MGVRHYRTGLKFEVLFYLDDRDKCSIADFLEALEQGGKREQQDAATLAKRLEDLSEHGPPHRFEHGHMLKNSDGIHELKAPGGARLFWFYQHGRVVVCSHGAHKPKSNAAYNAHIDRAQAARTALESATPGIGANKKARS